MAAAVICGRKHGHAHAFGYGSLADLDPVSPYNSFFRFFSQLPATVQKPWATWRRGMKQRDHEIKSWIFSV